MWVDLLISFVCFTCLLFPTKTWNFVNFTTVRKWSSIINLSPVVNFQVSSVDWCIFIKEWFLYSFYFCSDFPQKVLWFNWFLSLFWFRIQCAHLPISSVLHYIVIDLEQYNSTTFEPIRVLQWRSRNQVTYFFYHCPCPNCLWEGGFPKLLPSFLHFSSQSLFGPSERCVFFAFSLHFLFVLDVLGFYSVLSRQK
jgi:hypothetical protein